jgi:hypothetical protein
MVLVWGGRLGLARFKMWPTVATYRAQQRYPGGSEYQIGPGRPRQRIPGAFAARLGRFVGLYVRKGKARFPIVKPRGPSVPVVVTDDKNWRQTADDAGVYAALETEYWRQVQLVLAERLKGGAGLDFSGSWAQGLGAVIAAKLAKAVQEEGMAI